MSTEKTISVTRTDSYDQNIVTQAVRRHFQLLRLSEKIRPDMKVLIKPNLLMKRKPEEATTTHPSLLIGMIHCLKELGVEKITIADSPGGPYTKLALDPIYTATGMKEAAKAGAELNYNFGSFERKNEKGVFVKSFTLIQPVEDADFIIDAAKLKTHGMTMLSGAVKNLFGTVPGLMKPEFHWRFPNRENFCGMLLDLCETVRPDVVFVDGILAMEGDGPSGGTPRKTGMLLASCNPYEMDYLLCKILSIPPKEVGTVHLAMKRGLCTGKLEELELLGDPPLYFGDFQLPKSKSIDFNEHTPALLRGLTKKLLVSKPVIEKDKCIGCGKCAESCPASTIRVTQRKAEIDYKQCIHCFCCHEMCPVKAIEIKRFRLFNL